MATTEMNCVASGGGGALEYANYYADYNSGTTSITIPDNYDAILVVSSLAGSSDDYRPQYNGTTYEWMKGNKGSATYGAGAIIPNVKANTNITFSMSTACSVYGYNYA